MNDRVESEGGEEPVFALRGMRMLHLREHLASLGPMIYLPWVAYLEMQGSTPSIAWICLGLAVLTVVLWWWRFSRVYFLLFADRVEFRLLGRLVPRGSCVIRIDAMKYVRLRGATVRIYVRPGESKHIIYRLPFRRVLAEDFMDRFEMLCEEEGIPLRFVEEEDLREARWVSDRSSKSAPAARGVEGRGRPGANALN